MTDVPPTGRPRDPSVAGLRTQQERETETVALGTGGQWHGAVVGAVVGGIMGGLVLLVVALILFADTEGALVLLPLLGLAFGAVAGAVYEGGRNPEREGELQTAGGEPDPSAAVEGNPPSADEH